jgi:hypothetical protein
LFKNPTPDLIILLSVPSKENAARLRELQSLQVPIINFSSEHFEGDPVAANNYEESQTIHFYMELMRFLLLRFQKKQFMQNLSPEAKSDEADLHLQIRNIGRQFISDENTISSREI